MSAAGQTNLMAMSIAEKFDLLDIQDEWTLEECMEDVIVSTHNVLDVIQTLGDVETPLAGQTLYGYALDLMEKFLVEEFGLVLQN